MCPALTSLCNGPPGQCGLVPSWPRQCARCNYFTTGDYRAVPQIERMHDGPVATSRQAQVAEGSDACYLRVAGQQMGNLQNDCVTPLVRGAICWLVGFLGARVLGFLGWVPGVVGHVVATISCPRAVSATAPGSIRQWWQQPGRWWWWWWCRSQGQRWWWWRRSRGQW